jgi:hypothetical protein
MSMMMMMMTILQKYKFMQQQSRLHEFSELLADSLFIYRHSHQLYMLNTYKRYNGKQPLGKTNQ